MERHSVISEEAMKRLREAHMCYDEDSIEKPIEIIFEETLSKLKADKEELTSWREFGTPEEIDNALVIAAECLKDTMERVDNDKEEIKELKASLSEYQCTFDMLKEELQKYQKFGSPEEVAEMIRIAENSLRRNAALKRIIEAVSKIANMKDLI